MTRWSEFLKIIKRLYRWNFLSTISRVSNDVSKCKGFSPMSDIPRNEPTVPGDAAAVKSLRDIPGPEGLCSLPYIGSMFLFYPFTKFRPLQSNYMFEELHRKYGRIVKFRKGPRWSILLFDPDLIERAMLYEGKFPIRPTLPLIDAYSNRTGTQKGISQIQGEAWWRMRRPVQEFMLQPSNINQYIPILDEVANDMMMTITQLLQRDGRVYLENVMLRYAIESSAVYCINMKLGFQTDLTESKSNRIQVNKCPHVTQVRPGHSAVASFQFRHLTDLERSELIQNIKIYMQSVGAGYYTFPLYKFFRTTLYRDFEAASKYLSTVVQTRVTEIAISIKGKDQRSDGPNLLLSLICDGRLDLKTCTAMLTSFFSTATDTVSNSSVILLWHLAKNLPKQNILREEINRTIPSKQHVPESALSHMPYLKACLRESHRMTFPTPFGSVRVIQEDVILDEYLIPAGTCVHFGHNVLGHSSKYFHDPEKYLPERWLKQADEDNLLRRQRSIITRPFGLGRRNCVGRRIAELQIYLAVIKILQNYEISLGDPHEELDIVYKITASSSKSLDIRFRPL